MSKAKSSKVKEADEASELSNNKDPVSSYLGIGINKGNGEYAVNVVNINSDGTWSSVSSNQEDSRASAMERFKIEAARQLFNELNK